MNTSNQFGYFYSPHSEIQIRAFSDYIEEGDSNLVVGITDYAQAQLGAECCYQRCNLCEDQSETEWYATLQFQGIMTTCFGLDYMLRAEQISDGSDRCSELQGQYNDRCCSASSSSSL